MSIKCLYNYRDINLLIFYSQFFGITKISFKNYKYFQHYKKCPEFIKNELDKYFNKKSKRISLPFYISGTTFQILVWKELIKIPYGKTLFYSDIANKIGRPNSYRAVANACGKNPIPIIIPCHRVIAKNGLGGYSPGIKYKKYLLNLEKIK